MIIPCNYTMKDPDERSKCWRKDFLMATDIQQTAYRQKPAQT
jgi:hypothetical protein